MSGKQSAKTAQAKKQEARQAALANYRTQAATETQRPIQPEKSDRQKQAAAEAARRKRTATMRNTAIVAAVVIILGGGLAFMFFNNKEARDAAAAREADFAANPPGELVAQQSSPHIATLETAHEPYSTDPPTSGPHVQQVPDWKVYDQPIPLERQVHALEDAGIVVNYQPGLDKATVDRLAALVRNYSDHAGTGEKDHDNHVVMSPYPNLSHPIVLTAWRRIARLDAFDEVRIKRFIEAYKNKDHHEESGS